MDGAASADREYAHQSLKGGIAKLATSAPTLGGLQNAITIALADIDGNLGELEALYDQMVVKLGGDAHYDRPTTGRGGEQERVSRPERIGALHDVVDAFHERTAQRQRTLINLLSQISNRLD